MPLSIDDVESVMKGIWNNVLNHEVRRVEEPGKAPEEGGKQFSSCVQIMGDWQGTVTIALSGAAAVRIAAAMFAMEADAVGESEVFDAIGEIANMAGGNMKPLFGGVCQLSLPSVTEGRELRQQVPGATLLFKVFFDSEEGPFSVGVLQKAA